MMPRRPNARGTQSQERILDAALHAVAESGAVAATLADVAAAVGMTPAGLLHHFGSKENLFVEILRRRDAVDTERLDRTDPGDLPRAMLAARHNLTVPGIVDLYVGLTSAAKDRAHPAHRYFVDRYDGLQRRIADDVRSRQSRGGFDPAADAEQVAVLLIALMDGLQARWSIDPASVDIEESLRDFWRRFETGPTGGIRPEDSGRSS